MKRILLAILASSSLYFSACEKDENETSMEGLWYTRTESVQLLSDSKPITTYYKLFKKIDVENRRYKTYSFQKDRLTITEYTRDHERNSDIVNRSEYVYSVNGNQLLLTDSHGNKSSINHQFYGLGNKSLRLESLENVVGTDNMLQIKTSKTVLIREFPIDDSEQEVLGPDSGSGTPSEVQ